MPTSAALVHNAPMPLPFLPMPSPAAARQRDHNRKHPERETLELAAAGAAQVLGVDHGVTKALAKASITMGKVDLWHARLPEGVPSGPGRVPERPGRAGGRGPAAEAVPAAYTAEGASGRDVTSKGVAS